MTDAVTIARLRLVYPDIAVRYRRVAEDMLRLHQAEIRVARGFDTLARQREIYAQGRTAPGDIVTWTEPENSEHVYGLALDSCFLRIAGKPVNPWLDKDPRCNALWEALAKLGEAHGFVAGGHWKVRPDRPHLELTYGLRIAEIRSLYHQGGLPAVYRQIDKIRGVSMAEWYGPQARARLLNPGTPATMFA